MGRITDELVSLIKRQIKDAGIVVWYDPDRAYSNLIQNLRILDVPILRFDGSYFDLRKRLDPYLEFVTQQGQPKPDAATPPKAIVYLSKGRGDTAYALVEAESAGTVMEPGADHWQRNTRLQVIAERVFNLIAPDRATDIARQVERGTLTLEDLDCLAEQSAEIGAGAVKLIFGTASVVDVAIAFAASDVNDSSILAKQAIPELAGLFKLELGIEIDSDSNLKIVRTRFCRTLLLSDLVASLHPVKIPKELSAVPLPGQAAHLETIRQICRTWRNRLDYREAYVQAARAIDTEMNVSSFSLEPSHLVESETFPSVEEKLLSNAEQSLLEGNRDFVLELADRRKQSFWSIQDPSNQLRWSLLGTAALLLKMAARIKKELKSTKNDPAAMVQAYTAVSDPWCLLDMYYRHLEREYTTFDLELSGKHDRLEQVMNRVRQIYMEVVGELAESFLSALESADFFVPRVLQQGKLFASVVAPLKDAGKLAFICVDALRFEMARELLDGLGEDFEVSLRPALAQLPSITEVGMAALLPGAEKGGELVEAGPGKVGIKVGQTILKDRPSRIKYLRDAINEPIIEIKLNDLMKPSNKLKQEIGQAEFIFVTSQEIDRRGEEAEDEDEVRHFMDEVLEKLRRGIRRLAALGVNQVVIAADHGHLFGESIESGMKIDPPGGKTVDLHRRVWIGVGGSAADGYLRVPVTRLGLGGEMELALPRSLACFKAKGGSTAYFHGGASLQELVIPVAVVKALKVAAATAGTAAVDLVMDKQRVSTRFFSVTLNYSGSGLFSAAEKRVRVSVRAAGKEVGAAAMAAYGFEDGTQEIVLQKDRPNPVTMMLTSEAKLKSISIHVLDATTQLELKSLENIAVNLAV